MSEELAKIHHHDKSAIRYWTTLSAEDVPWPIRNFTQSARLVAKRMGVAFEGVELATSNGTYRILSDGLVQRTRIIPDCALPETEAWREGWTDEPHDGTPCVPRVPDKM